MQGCGFQGSTAIVDGGHSDPRYLACSLETKSEIVAAIARDGRVPGAIDIDSDTQAAFTEEDRIQLEAGAATLAEKFWGRPPGLWSALFSVAVAWDLLFLLIAGC